MIIEARTISGRSTTGCFCALESTDGHLSVLTPFGDAELNVGDGPDQAAFLAVWTTPFFLVPLGASNTPRGPWVWEIGSPLSGVTNFASWTTSSRCWLVSLLAQDGWSNPGTRLTPRPAIFLALRPSGPTNRSLSSAPRPG